MKLTVDPDVAKVAEFMERTIAAKKLQNVARALVQLGELIWPEKFPEYPFRAFGVDQDVMKPSAQSLQQPKTTSELPPLEHATPHNDPDRTGSQADSPD